MSDPLRNLWFGSWANWEMCTPIREPAEGHRYLQRPGDPRNNNNGPYVDENMLAHVTPCIAYTGPGQGKLVQCRPFEGPYNETDEKLSYSI